MSRETLRVGRIVKAQGIKGMVKVLPLSDDPDRFFVLKSILMETKDGIKSLEIQKCERRMDAIYLQLEGIDSREEAEKLRDIYLAVPREQAVELPDDHDFICDLIGCEVLKEAGESLGFLEDVLQYGAADVYVIKGEKDLMVPALKKLFISVDIPSKRMVVDEKILSEVALWDED